MSALEDAIARMQAEDREYRERAAADAAREVTLTADIFFRGDVLKVEVTGIAPFAAVPTLGPLTGTPCWTVTGQPYSKDGGRHTVSKSWDRYGQRFGALTLKASEAHTLAQKLNEQVAASALPLNHKAA